MLSFANDMEMIPYTKRNSPWSILFPPKEKIQPRRSKKSILESTSYLSVQEFVELDEYMSDAEYPDGGRPPAVVAQSVYRPRFNPFHVVTKIIMSLALVIIGLIPRGISLRDNWLYRAWYEAPVLFYRGVSSVLEIFPIRIYLNLEVRICLST